MGEFSVFSRGVRFIFFVLRPALVAQLVEHIHGKDGVGGSSPPEGSSKFDCKNLQSNRKKDKKKF